jgi:flagellar basal-body rod protein FlgC
MSDGIFSSFRVSAMGLRAQRMRLDVAAENLANIETTKTPDGNPYRPKQVVLSAGESSSTKGGGSGSTAVSFKQLLATKEGHITPERTRTSRPFTPGPELMALVVDSRNPFTSEYNPDHPDADQEGILLKPNIDPIGEMLNLIKATRAYEANATALDAAKEMLNRALEI